MRRMLIALCFISSWIPLGCQRGDNALPEPAPRPVTVLTLSRTSPKTGEQIRGVVGSWKTEAIGFEVSGRVEKVVEPETNVQGYLTGGQGDAIARIDPASYQAQVESAKANVRMLERQKEAAQIELDKVLPAKEKAAEAEESLQKVEFERSERLLARKALSQAEFDAVDAKYKQAQAQTAQVAANMAAKEAEVTSIQAKIDQANAQLKDAERDLENCQLKAPFRGQIAEVHVIPGGFVQPGAPVVTLQMMDPLKVEFQVSAAGARALKYKDPVKIETDEDEDLDGVIYQTGTVADAATRTFTVMVLVENKTVSNVEPSDDGDAAVAVTDEVWRLIRGPIGDGESFYTEENAIRHDEQTNEDYIYKIVEPARGQLEGKRLKVQRVNVVAGDERPSFLDLWTFRQVSLPEGADFDPNTDRLVGELELPAEGAWDGESVVFLKERWLMRPGDLVSVRLGERVYEKAWYVPVNAIQENSGTFFVFVVKSESGRTIAKRVEVDVFDGPDTLRRIELPEGSQEALADGDQLVAGGVQFLMDGETVNAPKMEGGE